MEQLNRTRGSIRARITRIVNEAVLELAKPEPSKRELTFMLTKLESLRLKVNEANDQITVALADSDATAEQFAEEDRSVDEYEDKVLRVTLDISEWLHPQHRQGSPPTSEAGSTNSTMKRNFKLPKIEIKKFDGDVRNWLSFWAQFQKIHEDETLHESDRFQYLLQAMVHGTLARETVESFPQTAENYPKAVQALKEKFGRETLLVQVYVRELLRLVISNSQSKEKIPLAKMYVKLESHLRALESLKLETKDPSTWLFPLVESSLPEEVLRAWQRNPFSKKDGSKENPPKSNLDYLMEFLKDEVQGEQQIALAAGGFFGEKDTKKSDQGQNKKSVQRDRFRCEEEEIPTAAGLHISEPTLCIFCEKNHLSQECYKARSMPLEEKKDVIKKKGACFICLKKGHRALKCKAFVKCTGCDGKHYHIFCQETQKNKKTDEAKTAKPVEIKTVASNSIQGGLVLLKTLIVRCFDRKLRVLFDDGSQKSYIKKFDGLSKCKSLGSHEERNMLFGGMLTDVEDRTAYQVPVKSLDGKVFRILPLTDKPMIAGCIPKVPSGPWMQELKNKYINLNDNEAETEEIDILVGSDLMPQLTTGKTIKLKCGMDAVETIFGWTLMGPVPEKVRSSHAMTVTTMHMSEVTCSQLWELEAIGIKDPADQKSKSEREAEVKEHFMNTVTRKDDGRYCVSLPWVGDMISVPSNKKVAESRLINTTRKLKKDLKTSDYGKIFKSWEDESFIEEVENVAAKIEESCHYLPHRAVYKPESKTTPVRPVFDASCKVGRYPSLNDCLEKGPNFIEKIPTIMHRFREGKYGVISDIRKAFQMIEMSEKDKDFLRFLWWEDEDCSKLKVYRHNRVVFGVNCSPFLLGAVLEFHLTRVQEEEKTTAIKLLESMYVDNCVTSVDSKEEYDAFKDNATRILEKAKMDLREWEYGPVEASGAGQFTDEGCGLEAGSVISSLETSVLGMKWDRVADTLRCDSVPDTPSSYTKRTLLSIMQKVFDPMGFLSPAMLLPKLILQETWEQKIDWDEELSEGSSTTIKKWAAELKCLEQIKIPRSMNKGHTIRDDYQLHIFSDASQYAYATVAFLRVVESGKVSVQMLQSKARVAPLKKSTIPRLELLGCGIGARLCKSVKDAFAFDDDVPTFFWSDSSTALAWIKGNDEWGTFVGNRVKEICFLSDSRDWRHVPGVFNPADLPSRGCTPKELLESRWWEGPSWLKRPQDEWPTEEVIIDEEVVLAEKRKSSLRPVAAVVCQEPKDPWYGKRSSFLTCVRVLAYIRRFVNRTRRQQFYVQKTLSIEELDAAELQLVKLVQQDVFPVEGEVISGLHVKNRSGLWCVETKLFNRQDTPGLRYPVLLPHSHPIVERLIREEYEKNGHAGAQFLMSKIREKYFIVKMRKAIRGIIQRCVICRRHAARPPEVAVAPLPQDRVKDARVFEVMGVDLAGPLYLKDKTKVWIVLFTCAIYRGIHMELVCSLNTDSFLLALIRFVKRRGRPSIIYSDNGTNFRGAENLFKELDWTRIMRETNIQRIEWKFNPPTAAWWGGWWERLIRTVKDLLKRMLGHSKLGYVQLETCICEVEAVVNGRPLTYVTEDGEDLVPLTPAMFMQDLHETSFPEEKVLSGENFRKKYNDLLTLKRELRQRFRLEYLGLLLQKGKMKKVREFSLGEVVLVASENQKRLDWPMARIIKLLPGKDGNIRVAVVKTSVGELTRPLQRLIPLEVQSESPILSPSPEVKRKAVESNRQKVKRVSTEVSEPEVPEPEVVTRAGRKVKKPVKFAQGQK